MMRRRGSYLLPPRRASQGPSSHSTPSLHICTNTGANRKKLLQLNGGCQGAEGRRGPTTPTIN
eukprot:1417141-Pyramimonas_sp.AAC.1